MINTRRLGNDLRSRSSNCAAQLRVGVAAVALVIAAPAVSQTAQDPPAFRNLDANGVDLVYGSIVFGFEEGSIGAGANKLALIRRSGMPNASQWDGVRLARSAGVVTVTTDTTSQKWTFSASTNTFSNGLADGSTLVLVGNDYTLTEADGRKIVFSPTSAEAAQASNVCWQGNNAACVLAPVTFIAPNGVVTTLTYDTYFSTKYVPQLDDSVVDKAWWRIRQIGTSSTTYILFNYQSNSPSPYASGAPNQTWLTRSGAVFGSNTASVGYTYPVGGTVNLTDRRGNVWQITGGADTLSVKRPGAATPNFTITRPTASSITVVNEGLTTNYSRSVNGTTATMTVTYPGSGQSIITSDINVGRPTSVRDPALRTVSYLYDANRRLTRVTNPESDYVEYTLDARGNATQTLRVAKPGSGLANIITSASYPATCTNPVSCNQPTWTRDAKGNQTDYTYDGTSGQLLTVTSPAAPNGIRPQTRYSYTNAGGVWLLSGTSFCRNQASCVNTADEIRTTITYNANRLPVTILEAAGDNSLSRQNTATYDAAGNLLTIDGPASGTGDTTRYRYDAARNRIGVVTADPDGAGSLKPLAQRTTLNVDGLATLTEVGNVNSQSDADWAGFAAFAQQAATYDANNRKTKDVTTVSGNTTAVQQYGYDALGRLQCSALRMDSAQWNSQTDACTPQTTAAAGQDRITRITYDTAGQVLTQVEAFGTTAQRTTQELTYNPNGTLASLKDGKGNRTGYTYDGFDRLLRTNFPTAGNGAVTSTTDLEQYGYDANGNRTSLRKRNGQTIGYAYDALNRVTAKTMPDASKNIAYTYTLQGQLRVANWPSGLGTTQGYDALGRLLYQVESSTDSTRPSGWDRGATYSYYDARGNRTYQVGYGPGYFAFQYDALDRMTRITDSAGVDIVSFTYDNQGRRATVSRSAPGTGAATTYTYDSKSRLASMLHNLDGAGTTNDLTQSFTYNNAGQIATRALSNDSYAFTARSNVNRPYAANGLNQFTSAGPASFTYDANGNLTSDGSVTYTYDTENRLTAASGAKTASLLYDPLGRLIRVHDGNPANARWFVYDRNNLLAEFDTNGTMVKRYLQGPGTDEQLAWFDGNTITATTPRHDMFADAQGSIVAITNRSGTTEAINRYDEFGIPQPGNAGRFGFTGQAWIPELGLSYYKARMYSPSMGRFMQTDPIGYDDGPNWYNYVGGDPVNRTDPSGMKRAVDFLKEMHDRGSGGNGTSSGGVGVGGSSGASDTGTIVVTGTKYKVDYRTQQLSLDFAFDMLGTARVGSYSSSEGVGGSNDPQKDNSKDEEPTNKYLQCAATLGFSSTLVGLEFVETGVALWKGESLAEIASGIVRGTVGRGLGRTATRAIVITSAAIAVDYAFNDGKATKAVGNYVCPKK